MKITNVNNVDKLIYNKKLIIKSLLMPKPHSTHSEIKELVIKAVKEGGTQSDLGLFTSPFWFRYFGYTKDPLESFCAEDQFTEELLGLYVNRKSEIQVISNLFGMVHKLPYHIHIAIIGSKGCGKHTTMKVIANVIHENFPEITFEFYNPLLEFDYKTSQDMSQEQINNIDETDLDIRIISCSGKNKWILLKRIKDFKKNTKITLSIWHSREYPLNDEVFINKKIFFRNYSPEVLSEILSRRIDAFLVSKDRSEKYYNNILTRMVSYISAFSQGNLKVCFHIFKAIHQRARINDTKEISKVLIEQVIEEYKTLREQKITQKEKEIINFYLDSQNMKFITTSDLKDLPGYDRTIAWKYLENLTNKGIFEKITYGNPSRYKLNEVFLSFYVDSLKKLIIFNET